MPSSTRLSVVYLLEDTVLFGGVKVILRQANLLADRGHRVTVVSRGSSPDWFQLRAEFRQISTFTRDNMPPADVTVATYWTTIIPALEAAHGAGSFYVLLWPGERTDKLKAILSSQGLQPRVVTLPPGDLMLDGDPHPNAKGHDAAAAFLLRECLSMR